ncbi:hypothetical protein L1987_18808 [Smallanthus sonchifolius]|uniref:Uncharacterized protein n=1 Tax=Smallanthus sonchifolius TaxID=185202 RepID=A0ACB9J1C5_9ASTR|nr:hypothetical protein L1987_18808 [Smallanthus sonchifolius]
MTLAGGLVKGIHRLSAYNPFVVLIASLCGAKLLRFTQLSGFKGCDTSTSSSSLDQSCISTFSTHDVEALELFTHLIFDAKDDDDLDSSVFDRFPEDNTLNSYTCSSTEEETVVKFPMNGGGMLLYPIPLDMFLGLYC